MKAALSSVVGGVIAPLPEAHEICYNPSPFTSKAKRYTLHGIVT